MHEQSLVRSLLRQVDGLRRRHGAERAVEVRVAVGPLSGVEPPLLTAAYELMTAALPEFGPLVIEPRPLRAACGACEFEFDVAGFEFRCPECGGNVRVVSGDQLELVSVSLADGREPG